MKNTPIRPGSHSTLLFGASLTMLSLLLSGCVHPGHGHRHRGALSEALLFHASFDGKIDADVAAGDRQLYWAPSMKERTGQPGLPPEGHVSHVAGAGRFGDALRFHKKAQPIVFFQGQKNVDYRTENWNGTVSLWLKVDPARELEPGFTDPVQITPRQWNDASFFVEFEKRTNSIPFRLGAYADFKVWNPENRDWGKIPFEEKPLVHIHEPPFSGDRWTHVVFTFENFNSGRADGVAKLYLNGKIYGLLSPRLQTYTWDMSSTLIMLGLSYIGLLDELSVFNRALSDAEVAALHSLDGGVRALGRRR